MCSHHLFLSNTKLQVANSVAVRAGQVNQAGDPVATFLKVFGGEVLTAFAEYNKFASRTMVRTITAGKSAQFPASWKGSSQYHTVGNEIVGTTFGFNERVITIDDLLIADRFLATLDEAMAHFDVRSIISRDSGMALARQWDKNLAQVGILAARAAATVTGGDGGTAIVNATSLTNADSLIASLMDAAQALDEKNVPSEDRYIYIKPDQYYNLVNSSSKLINRDYNGEDSKNGSVAEGTVYRCAGMEIVKTNNLPQSNVVTGPAAYQGNFSTTSALVMQKGAVGTVKLIDLAVEAEYEVRFQGWLLVAKYAVGHGILRPECSVEIKTA